MAEQRFRFRLPWLSAVTAPRPTTEPQPQPTRPAAQAQAPVVRPPFRPAGIAPIQPPSETQPQSRPPAESKVLSPTPSPSRTTQTRAASIPPSPSRRVTEAQVTISQPASRAPAQTQVAVSPVKSPSQAATQPRAGSLPPSPSHSVASQTQPAAKVSPQHQSSSPSRVGTQLQADSVPSSPSRAASKTQQTIKTSPPPQSPSPSRAGTQSRVVSVPPSPSRAALQTQPKVKSTLQPQSPPPPRSAPQPTSPKAAQTPSPSKELQQSRQETSQHPLSLTQSPAFVSQRRESKAAGSQQLLQEPQPKTIGDSETVQGSQYKTPGETTVKPDMVLPRTTEAPHRVTDALMSIAAQESEQKPREIKEKEVLKEPLKGRDSEETKEAVAREVVKSEKSEVLDHEEQGWRTQGKELLSTIFHTNGYQQEKEESTERKKPWATPTSGEREIKTVNSTHQKDRNTLGMTHQKPDRSNGERPPLHKEMKQDLLQFTHKLGIEHPKQSVDEKPVSFITLAGENRGASMHLGSESAKKYGSIPIHRGYKLKTDESPETTSEGEERHRATSADPRTKETNGRRAYVNNNVQSINNSIMFHSSVNERNPGVHLVFSHNLEEPIKPTTQNGHLLTHENSFRTTPSQKLTYEPTVRRRCLRGLFMEPSDSDPDNPEKPRRHGCLYSCGEKSNNKNIGIL